MGAIELFIDTSPSDLDFHLRSQECEKTKTSVPVVSKFSINSDRS